MQALNPKPSTLLDLGPLHIRSWELLTSTLQALSLVEKAVTVQIRFKLHLRDQRSVWVQDGCKTLHAFIHGIEWIMFHGHLDYFQNPPLGGRPNTKPSGDHGTPNAHNRQFILFHHVWEPAWIGIHWDSIWWRAGSHIASHYIWGFVTTLYKFGGVLGRPSDSFIWALTTS